MRRKFIMKNRVRAAAGVLVCLAGMAVVGQTTAPAQSGSELERLRAENAELKKEVAALRAKLAAAPAAATAASQPAKKETVRMFTTMTDALANVPADLRPQPKAEWHKFQEGKFLKWAREQLVGLTLDTNLQWFGGPSQRNVVYWRRGGEWIINSGGFGSKSFTSFGAEHTWSVRYPHVMVDEAGARKWDAIKKGSLFKVKGVIKTVSISKKNHSQGLPQYHFSFEMQDLEFAPANQ
jgi:hypothetical protein